ncbi:hypothetical protein [Bradyrhizobium sp. CCBAU 11386]|uniref:hypothetical protein n=1 Tax=Bradyrhizobium sp. CCBAU 11386 TaxID=1630837 RepID=UPI0023040703|nr:hypothetical protein [Bradyrhizobium sp. CCBAU 11386]
MSIGLILVIISQALTANKLMKDSTAARRRVDRDQAELVASQRLAQTFRCANLSARASSRSLAAGGYSDRQCDPTTANTIWTLRGQPKAFGIAMPGLVSPAAAALLTFRRGTLLGPWLAAP